MEFLVEFWEKLNGICAKVLDFTKMTARYKKLILAVPVAASAVMLAIVNLFRLPGLVDLGILVNGEVFEIEREVAVLGPLFLTGVCLLMLIISKRTLTPWMVSVISLLLPIVLLITNALSL